MSLTRTDLPYEILHSIFDHLDRLSDVFQCQLTCKKWCRLAQDRFYRTVILNKRVKLESFIRTIRESSSQPGNFVKTLEIGYLFRPNQLEWDEQNNMTYLIEHCPNVENLITKQHFAELWQRLLAEHARECWTSLQRIPSPVRTPHLPAYVPTALAYRSTLKSLFLGDRVGSSIDPHPLQISLYNAIFQKLQEFPYLTDLEIKVYTDKSLFELESIIDICPSSLELVFFTGYRPNAIECYQCGVRDGYEIQDMTLVTPQLNIQTFKSDRLMLTDLSTVYLMYKFPNISNLIINRGGLIGLMYEEEEDEYYRDGDDQEEDEEGLGTPHQRFDISPDTQFAFFKYLSTMRSFDVYGVFAQNVIEVMERFITVTSSMNLIVKLRYSAIAPSTTIPDVRICKPSCFRSLHYHTAESNTNVLEIGYGIMDAEQNALPFDNIIMHFGFMLNHLHISAGTAAQFFNPQQTKRFRNSMKQSLIKVIQHCPRLKTLTIGDADIKDNLFDDDYSSENEGEQDDTKHNVNMSIENIEIEFSTLYDDGLVGLVRRLPSLKNLTLSGCDFRGENSFGGSVKSIFIPNTRLDSFTWKLPFNYSKPHLFIDMYCKGYYFIDYGDLRKLDEDEFLELTNKNAMVLNIYIKSLKTFKVQYNSFYQEYDLNNVK